MKTTYSIATLAAALLLWAGASSSGKAQNTNRNYVMKTVHASADSTQAKRRAVAYYDGLGRPVQTIRWGGSPDGHDLADRVEYDSLGREFRAWQTARSPYSNGNPVDSAAFVPIVQSFYSDAAPFRETQYDGSPLDRIRKVTAPGQVWHAADKGVTSGYLTNSETLGADSLQCVKYSFTLSGNTGILFGRDGLWPAGSLTVSRTEDEDGRTLWVYKDMRDLTVLERRLAEAATGNIAADYADTYYLYDDAGRLTAVLPPELSAYFGWGDWSGSSETDPKVEGFAYQYRYDARGRMVAKKLPGAAWTYYVYDKGDRLVLMQDGNHRVRSEWSFRLKDALGRECLTGTLTGSYNAFADPLGGAQVLAVRNYATGTYDDLHGYSVSGLTLPSSAEIHTVNWWDDYAFLGHEPGMADMVYGYSDPASNSGYDARYAASSQGLLTGHWSKTLGDAPGNWAAAVRETWYYDDHGRVVYHVKGYPSGSKMTERSGYSFAGELTASGRSTILSENTQKTEAYTYTYDGWGRPLNTSHSLDGGTALLLSANAYDAVGRLSQTKRGGTSVQNSTAALTDSYTYNVRDWLTGIGGLLFSETLTYETPRTGSTLPGQWSGNISGMQWNTGGTSTPRYDFDYDLLGRLTEAKFGGVSGLSLWDYSRTYGYDLNGNMEGMETPATGYMGDYKSIWNWTASDGNRPTESERVLYKKGIGPGGTPIYSPVSGSAEEEEYAYDAVGNLMATLDSQGDTLNVMHYNLLNLPEEYVTDAGDTVKYVYSADGEKLYVQEIPSSGPSMGTEYAANYRLEDGSLTMIHTDAGYYTPVTPPSGAGSPSYSHIWYLKDHLGNNRILADGSGNALKIHHYDPFGIQIAVTGGATTSFPSGATESPYKYGGKEWNVTTSTYDFEARQFAPAFHRFTTMDPLCENYYGISPYAYCAGNPINLVDPDGMQWYLCTNAKEETTYEYYEGEMSDEEKNKYTNVEMCDKLYFVDPNTNTYYSLFGRKIPWNTQDGRPNEEARFAKVVDRLIFTFFANIDDGETGAFNKVLTYINDLPAGKRYDSHTFFYAGKTFSTLRDQDLPYSDSFSHSCFWNCKDARAAIYKLSNLPTEPTVNNNFLEPVVRYWLRAGNSANGVSLKGGNGFTYVQLEFDGHNANEFLKSCVNLFPDSKFTPMIKSKIK